jgi:hypothetical protein
MGLRLTIALFPIMACIGCANSQNSQNTVSGDNNSGESKFFVPVLIGFDVMSDDGIWEYSAKGSGKVAEATWEEYQEQEMAAVERNTEDDIIWMPEEVPPGCLAFVFRGIEAGDVELVFTSSDPGREQVVVFIEVLSDKTLVVKERIN